MGAPKEGQVEMKLIYSILSEIICSNSHRTKLNVFVFDFLLAKYLNLRVDFIESLLKESLDERPQLINHWSR